MNYGKSDDDDDYVRVPDRTGTCDYCTLFSVRVLDSNDEALCVAMGGGTC